MSGLLLLHHMLSRLIGLSLLLSQGYRLRNLLLPKHTLTRQVDLCLLPPRLVRRLLLTQKIRLGMRLCRLSGKLRLPLRLLPLQGLLAREVRLRLLLPGRRHDLLLAQEFSLRPGLVRLCRGLCLTLRLVQDQSLLTRRRGGLLLAPSIGLPLILVRRIWLCVLARAQHYSSQTRGLGHGRRCIRRALVAITAPTRRVLRTVLVMPRAPFLVTLLFVAPLLLLGG